MRKKRNERSEERECENTRKEKENVYKMGEKRMKVKKEKSD